MSTLVFFCGDLADDRAADSIVSPGSGQFTVALTRVEYLDAPEYREPSMTIITRITISVLLTMAVGSTTLHAQQDDKARSNVLRVGVPIMENTSTRTINRKQQRDWLVRGFQPEKKKKKKAAQSDTVQIEAVALDSDSPGDAIREAREKNCQYILYTNLVELREPGDPRPQNQPNSASVGGDPLSAYPDPTIMHDPVHYAQVDYRLERVGGESEALLASSVSGEEHSDENGTVERMLFLIVNSVKSELRDSGGARPRTDP